MEKLLPTAMLQCLIDMSHLDLEDSLHPMRRLYRRYLARYGWARRLKSIALGVWVKIKPIRDAITRRISSLTHGCSSYQLLSLPNYLEAESIVTYELAPPETTELYMPSVYPVRYRRHMHSGVWLVKTPAVCAIEIRDAEVMGCSDFVFADQRCLHHGLYRFERDLTAEETRSMITIKAKKKVVHRFTKAGQSILTLPGAISMLSGTSGNYVHWLTETAPKLALIDEIAELSAFPLLIDADLHPNILESLYWLNTQKREVVYVKKGQICKINRLIYVTPTSYTPFDYQPRVKPERLGIDPSWAMYHPRGVHMLKQKLLHRFQEKRQRGSVRRLYLRRTSKSRQMHNLDELEAVLFEFGFQVIEPETLSFSDQVKYFWSAEIIVAQAGAALGNLIFAPKGSQVVILAAYSSFNNYYYFSNLASILGLRCTYVLCTPDDQHYGHPAHKGFKVDIKALRKVMSQWQTK